MGKILFQAPGNEEAVEFYVLEQAKIGGVDYLLVTEEEEGDCEAYILKEVTKQSDSGDEESVYEIVESEDELQYMSKIFTSVLEDVEIEI